MKNFGTFGIFAIVVGSVILGGLYKHAKDDLTYRLTVENREGFQEFRDGEQKRKLKGLWESSEGKDVSAYQFLGTGQGFAVERSGSDFQPKTFTYKVMTARLHITFNDTGKSYLLPLLVDDTTLVLEKDPLTKSKMKTYRKVEK